MLVGVHFRYAKTLSHKYKRKGIVMKSVFSSLTKNLFAEDSENEFRIKNDTERYRKGFGDIRKITVNGEDISSGEIHFKLKKHEFKFGCNSFMFGEFDDTEKNQIYAEKFKELFNLAVVPFYWSDLEPNDGELRFEKNSRPLYRRPPPDLIVEFCEKNNITPKGHPLMWHLWYPEWLPKDLNKLSDRIEQRFQEIAERYGKRIKIWDVINEPLTWGPTALHLPERHIELVFKLAEKYFSAGSTFIYNDVTHRGFYEFDGRYTPMDMLATHLLSKGLKLDCLGLQYHMFFRSAEQMLNDSVGGNYYNPSRLFAIMDQHAQLGIPFNISEVSIPGNEENGGEEYQALITEKLYRIWFSHPANTQIIWWNLVDGAAAHAPKGSNEGENLFKAGFMNYDFSEKQVCKVFRNLLKEWHTDCKINYDNSRTNKFHGYYGDYEAIIKCNKGTFTTNISLLKGGLNQYSLEFC